MVYDLFRIYYMCLKSVLEYFQVQIRFEELWWLWSFLRCRTAKTHQMFSYGWRYSHGAIEPIVWHTIELWVKFLMLPVWGQSASYNRSYAWFTGVVYMPRKRKMLKIWRSVDRQHNLGVDRRWFQKMGRAYFMTDLSPEVTTYLPECPWMTLTLFMFFLSHCWRVHFLLLLLFIVLGLERRDWLELLWFYHWFIYLLSKLWFVLLLPCLSNHYVRFRDFMSLMSN